MITSGIYIFISQATSDANTHFDIKTLTPHNNDRFVIQYIFSLERNSQAIGLDIGSEADRRGAALDAARTNQPRLTAPITLVQEGDKPRRGVLILLPIYPSGANLLSPEEREEKVLGWAYAPLVIDDVLAKLDGIINQSEITLSNLSESEPFIAHLRAKK